MGQDGVSNGHVRWWSFDIIGDLGSDRVLLILMKTVLREGEPSLSFLAGEFFGLVQVMLILDLYLGSFIRNLLSLLLNQLTSMLPYDSAFVNWRPPFSWFGIGVCGTTPMHPRR